MTNIIDEAKAYEPKQMKNIADLEKVPTTIEVFDKDFRDTDGKPFSVKVVTIDGEDYRVPVSVLKDLKVLWGDSPGMKFFKVIRTGEGMKTVYTTIKTE